MNKGKILVVDDEPIILDMLEDAFSKVGYSVFLATNADEAFKILKHESIPLMFLDLGLCENIRKDNPEAIIYALTGYAGLLGSQEMLESGFDDYFAKPISLKDLYQAVKASFEKLDSYQ
jgi:DNA-binding response OmpR family regulator